MKFGRYGENRALNLSSSPCGHRRSDWDSLTIQGQAVGSGFWVYRGDGARLEWALLNYFIETHLNDGYEMMLVPHLLNYQCGYTAGQFPKFEEDVYWLDVDTEADHRSGQFLLPTAETALVNIHKDEILNAEDLPKKYFAYSPCYRKEAGSYRAEERGMIRGHSSTRLRCFRTHFPNNQAFRSW